MNLNQENLPAGAFTGVRECFLNLLELPEKKSSQGFGPFERCMQAFDLDLSWEKFDKGHKQMRNGNPPLPFWRDIVHEEPTRNS
jgi:hypothetical protein